MKFELKKDKTPEPTVLVDIYLASEWNNEKGIKDVNGNDCVNDVVIELSKQYSDCYTSSYIQIARVTHDGKLVLLKIEKEDAKNFGIPLDKGYIKVEKEK
jgi:hypothetical protein